MSILQKVYFPQDEICNKDNMYIRLKGNVSIISYNNEKVYCLDENAKILTNTYFNYFSSSKWLKYTKIKKFDLNLNIKGKFTFKLIYAYIVDGEVQNDVVKILDLESDEKKDFLISYDFSLDAFEGMYYFELEGKEKNSMFFSAEYQTDIEILNKIRIGIIFCTFKREVFIKRNLELIRLLSKEVSSKIEIFVVDNAKTLSENLFTNNNEHLIKNKNTGGAGGFTRGLIEILQNFPYITHALLMDDDILLNIIAVERSISFLEFIKEENKDLFIGGATLRLDKKNIQLEAGAVWNNSLLYNLKSNFDLENDRFLLINNLEESFSYNAWVFLCIPISKISLNNLPLPVFVRGDDMEYGIRLIDKLLLVNGIGVWHVPVHNKYSSFMTYYVLRNILILNSLYDINFKVNDAIKLLIKRVARECMYYRYDNVELVFKAYKDFLSGIDFFLNTDGETLHKKIMGYSDKLFDYKTLEKKGYPFVYSKYRENNKIVVENKIKKVLRLFTLNGYLLPRFFYKREKYNIVEFTSAKPINFYRYKYVLQVDLTTQKGCITYVNNVKLIKIGIQLLKIILNLLCKYNTIRKDYNNNISKLRNITYWKKYLDIKE